MKISRLAISSVSEFQSGNESFLNYILPCKETISDFYSDKDFTLIVSNTGQVWKIGSFFEDSGDPFEYRSLGFNLIVQAIVCNGHCALLLTHQGKVYGWGKSDDGILEEENSIIPKQIKWLNLKKVVEFSISSTYAGCVDEQGSSYIWGTFPSHGIQKSFHQVNDPKLFTCKDLLCRENFFVICTDGGFVYYQGTLGNHPSHVSRELTSFPELEEKCVIQIAASESFISIHTEQNELFAFDACHQLIKIPFQSPAQSIIANKSYLIITSQDKLQKWSEGQMSKTTKSSCILKDFKTKIFKINEKFEVTKVKAMNHIYGIIFFSDSYEKIEGSLVSTLNYEGNQELSRRSQEESLQNLEKLSNLFQKLTKKSTFFAFIKIFQVFEQKTSIIFILNHSKLPFALIEIINNSSNRSKMLGFTSIKNEMLEQDLAARERIRRIREGNKYKQGKILSLLKTIQNLYIRSKSKLLKSSLYQLVQNKNSSNLKQKVISNLFSCIRSVILKYFLQSWQKTTSNHNLGLLKIIYWAKSIKSKKKLEAFSLISSRATFKVYLKAKKSIQLSKCLKSYSSKSTRLYFNTWKSLNMKLKAIKSREQKKYQLSVRLGCKYFFPVINCYLHTYWSKFKQTSSNQIKPRYLHFSQFLTYFLKKKLLSFSAISFLRISGASASLTMSPEDSQYSRSSIKEDKLNSSLISSLNTLIDSHKKKISSCVNSPKIPKLYLANPASKSKVSASLSTFRPPWKPASNPNSRQNTPKSGNRKQDFPICQTNRCLRSLNILPINKNKLIEKRKASLNKGEKIRVELGIYNLQKAVDSLVFRLKFRSFSYIKFYG